MKPEEWARLQRFLGYGFLENGIEKFSFPEDISNTQKYKQLGNSVAILVIEKIAHKVIQTIDNLEGKI
jgi:DNA (cytosine-5)-methyltransferase 1